MIHWLEFTERKKNIYIFRLILFSLYTHIQVSLSYDRFFSNIQSYSIHFSPRQLLLFNKAPLFEEEKKMVLKVYMTNITSNQLIIGNQRKLKHILDTNKIDYIDIDISDTKNNVEKQFLQRVMASLNQKMILPQIFHDDQYCCDFDGLISAVESNTLKQTLKLDHQNGN